MWLYPGSAPRSSMFVAGFCFRTLALVACLDLISASSLEIVSSTQLQSSHQRIPITHQHAEYKLAKQDAIQASLTGKKILDHLKTIRIVKKAAEAAKPADGSSVASRLKQLQNSVTIGPNDSNGGVALESKSVTPMDAKLASVGSSPDLSDTPDSIKSVSLGDDEPGAALGDVSSSHPNLAAQLHAVHQKAMAKKRLGAKAQQTDDSEEAKNSAHAVQILPFVLPPIGIIVLGTITYAVISIRNWQKIPSMPTQGRMDIEAVRASAQRAGGGKSFDAREMRHASGPVR